MEIMIFLIVVLAMGAAGGYLLLQQSQKETEAAVHLLATVLADDKEYERYRGQFDADYGSIIEQRLRDTAKKPNNDDEAEMVDMTTLARTAFQSVRGMVIDSNGPVYSVHGTAAALQRRVDRLRNPSFDE